MCAIACSTAPEKECEGTGFPLLAAAIAASAAWFMPSCFNAEISIILQPILQPF